MSEEVRLSIHRYFEEFGYEIGEAVYRELAKPGGMPKLLKKLGVPSEGRPEEQYALLIQYFRARGLNEFMKIAGLKPLDYKIGFVPSETQKVERDWKAMVSARRPGDGTGPSATPPPRVDPIMETRKLKPAELPPPTPPPSSPIRPATPPPSPAVTPHPRPASVADPKAVASRQGAYDVTDNEGFPVGPLIPGAAPTPGKGGLSWDPSKPHDPNGTWPEVERRSPRERRRRTDRRSSVDLVYKNLRFGKDRRLGGERRKGWPPGGHQK